MSSKKCSSSGRPFVMASAIGAVVLGLAGSSAHAQNVYWDGGAGADTNWSTSSNWSTDAEPTIESEARLNNGGTITISNTGEIALTFRIGEAADTSLGAANLGLGGTVNFNAGGELATGPFVPSVDVGVAPGSTSVWNHNGGTLTTLELFRLGVDTGSTGVLNMHAGTIDVSTTDTTGLDFFLVGDNGNGTLNMDGGTIKSRGLFAVGLQARSNSTVTMSGGVIDGRNELVVGGNSDIPAGVGGQGSFNMSGGTASFTGAILLGRSAFSNGTVVQSGGSMTARDLLVGLFSSSTYAISGNATLDLNGQLNVATFTPLERPDGSPTQPASSMTQSGTSSVTTGGMVVGEFGDATYTINGGTLTVLGVPRNGATLPNDTFRNLLIGRDGGGAINQGRGRFIQNGGAVSVATNVVLGDFDDSDGRYTISGGTLAIGGNLVVGGALATNAPADDVRLEPSEANGAQGQAANTRGTFTVRGGAATINVTGKLIANPGDKGAFRNAPGQENHATLAFEVGNAGALSRINVGQQADLDGAVIDMGFLSSSLFVPAYQQQFQLINAQLFGATGTGTTQNVGTGSNVTLAAGDAIDWSLTVVTGGDGRQTLVATNLVVPGDTDSDKNVDFDDLVVLAQNYGQLTGRTRATGDFNRTSGTDFDDLVILAQNYGFSALTMEQLTALGGSDFAGDWILAQSLVPEPATLTILVAGSLVGAARRRRMVLGQ